MHPSLGRRWTRPFLVRASLHSLDLIVRSQEEVTAYLQRYFGLEPKVAADSYRILKEVLTPDGDIEEAVLKSIVDKIRQESGITTEIALDRLVDLSILR